MINIKYDTKKKVWTIKDNELNKILRLAAQYGEEITRARIKRKLIKTKILDDKLQRIIDELR